MAFIEDKDLYPDHPVNFKRRERNTGSVTPARVEALNRIPGQLQLSGIRSAIDYLTNETQLGPPRSVSPVILTFTDWLDDVFVHHDRHVLLYPLANLLVNTVAEWHFEQARGLILSDFLLRELVPMVLKRYRDALAALNCRDKALDTFFEDIAKLPLLPTLTSSALLATTSRYFPLGGAGYFRTILRFYAEMNDLYHYEVSPIVSSFQMDRKMRSALEALLGALYPSNFILPNVPDPLPHIVREEIFRESLRGWILEATPALLARLVKADLNPPIPIEVVQ